MIATAFGSLWERAGISFALLFALLWSIGFGRMAFRMVEPLFSRPKGEQAGAEVRNTPSNRFDFASRCFACIELIELHGMCRLIISQFPSFRIALGATAVLPQSFIVVRHLDEDKSTLLWVF